MSQDDELKKKLKVILNDKIPEDQDDEGEGGKGDAGSQIAFREFIGGEALRDDLLSGEEKRRLLSVHEDAHEAAVKKQKETSDNRKQLLEGKITLSQYRAALGNPEYLNHPILSYQAQFNGMSDKEVNALPNDLDAKTNQDMANELQYRYNLTHRPKNAPSAPELKRR